MQTTQCKLLVFFFFYIVSFFRRQLFFVSVECNSRYSHFPVKERKSLFEKQQRPQSEFRFKLFLIFIYLFYRNCSRPYRRREETGNNIVQSTKEKIVTNYYCPLNKEVIKRSPVNGDHARFMISLSSKSGFHNQWSMNP